MKIVKTLLRFILFLGFMYGMYTISIITYASITDWIPRERIPLISKSPKTIVAPLTFKLLTWNLGFGGLGEETDFFYDGGKTVIQKEKICRKNIDGAKSFLKANTDIDFILLQEVDSCSRRNHRINMVEEIEANMPEYSSAYALNYNVDFVPVPHGNPLGETRSGLLSLSKYATVNVERVAFDTQFEWPRQLFFLDRCVIKQTIPLENGKKLILMNTHCSAYDVKGDFVAAEIQKMVDLGEIESKKGNYVIIGGDWNQIPPDYTPLKPNSETNYNEFKLTNEQIPNGWKWVADVTIPTNRKLDIPYQKGVSYTSVIDHYLVSKNVRVKNIAVQNLNFQFSDHQPVLLEVELLN